MLSNLGLRTLLIGVRTVAPQRSMAVRARKRFYKNVGVVSNSSEKDFELTLDSKKLKTPLGKTFKVDNETLANAVAQEWRSQTDLIMTSQMHLTGLCNVSIDNPTNATKEMLVDDVLNFLDTDTVLFFAGADENERLQHRQEVEWTPVIRWFAERYGVDIQPSRGVHELPRFSEGAKAIIRNHLLSFDMKAVQGFCFGVDAIKSIILMLGLIERKFSVEQAIKLTRLETDYQTEQWGNVEWAHDLELHDTTARVAAATMFVHLTSSQYLTRKKDSDGNEQLIAK